MENPFILTRPIVFFDLETTGVNIMKDKIIQIAMIKYEPGQTEPTELNLYVNPEMLIPADSTAIHGITDEMVKDKPPFRDLHQQLITFIGEADLSGFNSNRFDVPLLIEEFYRAGHQFDISKRKLIDVQRIFHKMEPRTLKAAYKVYCGEDLKNAHDALADTRATVEVFKGQIRKYAGVDYVDADGKVDIQPITQEVDKIAAFIHEDNMMDITNRLKINSNGEVIFNFGKYIGQPVTKVFRMEQSYYHWIMEKEFSAQVKQMVAKIYKEIFPNA